MIALTLKCLAAFAISVAVIFAVTFGLVFILVEMVKIAWGLA